MSQSVTTPTECAITVKWRFVDGSTKQIGKITLNVRRLSLQYAKLRWKPILSHVLLPTFSVIAYLSKQQKVDFSNIRPSIMSLLKWKIFMRISQRNFSTSVVKRSDVSNTVDGRDVGRFEELSQSASEWMNEQSGAFKALHSFNRLRVPWIAAHLSRDSCIDMPLKGLRLVDVGCGGGLLSMSLCRLGAEVIGLDASTSAIKVARLTADRTLSPDQRDRLKYVSSSVEQFSGMEAERFDGVVASEIVEHVNDLQSFVHHCVKLGKSDSKVPLFFTTINKTVMSRLLAVWMAENVLSIVPRGVHDWEKFVEPEILKNLLLDENCKVGAPLGIAYNPFSNSWSWSSCHLVNYAIKAIKA